jgi:hypothetical protein
VFLDYSKAIVRASLREEFLATLIFPVWPKLLIPPFFFPFYQEAILMIFMSFLNERKKERKTVSCDL